MIENGQLTICQGQWKTPIERIENIPMTWEGRAESMIRNLLPAVLVAVIRNMRTEHIRAALKAFIPSPEFTPGRMNMFEFREFDLLVDYAHNVDGFMTLKKFIERTEANSMIGVVGVTGDRRDEDIRSIGMLCAEMFDKMILRHDKDLRESTAERLEDLFLEGVNSVRPEMAVEIIPSELEAVGKAISIADRDDLVVVCADSISEVLAFVGDAYKKDLNKPHKAGTPADSL
jgi:cyanophycin synthetase